MYKKHGEKELLKLEKYSKKEETIAQLLKIISINFIIIKMEVFYLNQLLRLRSSSDQILKERYLISLEEIRTTLKITDLQLNHGLMFVGKVLEPKLSVTWRSLWVIISLPQQKVVMM